MTATSSTASGVAIALAVNAHGVDWDALPENVKALVRDLASQAVEPTQEDREKSDAFRAVELACDYERALKFKEGQARWLRVAQIEASAKRAGIWDLYVLARDRGCL